MQLGDIVQDVARPEITGRLQGISLRDGKVIYHIRAENRVGLGPVRAIYDSENCVLASEFEISKQRGMLGMRVRCEKSGRSGLLARIELGAGGIVYILNDGTEKFASGGITRAPEWRLGDVVSFEKQLWTISAVDVDLYTLWRDDGAAQGPCDDFVMYKPMLVKGDCVSWTVSGRTETGTVVWANNVANKCRVQTGYTDMIPVIREMENTLLRRL